jgi:Cyclin, N-terminal domain/Cyclin, C-terminal domain
MQDSVDTVRMMMIQERSSYVKKDYLSRTHSIYPSGTACEVTRVLPCTFIDATWRQRIIEWMFGVVDHCFLRRDSVAVAAYYLDVCVSRGIVANRQDFQLVAMTALQLAIKLYDTTVVKIDSMIKLGRGMFVEQDVIDMEMKMLAVLKWQVHPPTPICFLRQFLRLLPNTASPATRYMITEVTRFVTEITVCLYRFVVFPSSTVAYAGMLVAMARINTKQLPEWQRQQIYTTFASFLNLHHDSPIICEIMYRLEQSLEKNFCLQELINTIDQQCRKSEYNNFNNSCSERFTSVVNYDNYAETCVQTTSNANIRSPRDVCNDHI